MESFVPPDRVDRIDRGQGSSLSAAVLAFWGLDPPPEGVGRAPSPRSRELWEEALLQQLQGLVAMAKRHSPKGGGGD